MTHKTSAFLTIKLYIYFILLTAWLCLPATGFAEKLQTGTEIGEIETNINGNNRTRSSYINDLITDCFVDENIHSWQQLEAETIKQCVLNAKIFAMVQVTVNKPLIDIVVEERWTLLPLPYVYSNGDDYSAGLFLLESNLFGLGKKAGIGGSLSSNGSSYFFYYFDPSIQFSDWSYSFKIGNKVLEPVLKHNDQEYYSYEMEEFSYDLNLSRKVLLPELWLSFGINGKDLKYEQVDLFPPPNDYDSFSLKTRIFYKDTDFKFYFNEGPQVNFDYILQVNRSDDNSNTKSWNLTVDWQKQFIKNNAIQFQVQLQEVSDGGMGDALLLGGQKGFRGINQQGLWVNSAQSVSIDYQILIKQYGYGSWTVAPFVDITHFDPVIDIPSDSFISCGVGGYLYLKNIAIPGLGLLLGYNNEFEGFFVSLSLGMMM